MKYPRKATVFWPAHHRSYKVLNMENIVGHYTAYSVEKKMSSLYFLGGGGSSERVPEVLMDLHEPHGRHCS